MDIQTLQQEKEQLEKRLGLERLQLNTLLSLTQGINENWKSDDIYRQYHQMLSFNLGLKCFALITQQDDENWEVVSYTSDCLNAEYLQALTELVPSLFERYERPSRIAEADTLLHEHFDLLVPVFHKQQALALLLLSEELSTKSYESVQEHLQLIRTLTNIVSVAIENKRLFKRQMAEERLRRDVELAVQVQNMLLPQSLPQNEHYALAGFYQPHEGVGGDYYDFIRLGEDKIAFCIADISGKGIAAALIMSNFQAALRSLIYQEHLSAEEFISELNQAVWQTTRGDKFISFFIGHYNIKTRRLLYINAGHNHPLLYSQGQLRPLDKGSCPLGIFQKLPAFEYETFELKSDSLIFLYTDGLSELMNAEGEQFLIKLEDFVQRNAELDVERFNKLLLKEALDFRGSKEFDDDISLLTVRLFL